MILRAAIVHRIVSVLIGLAVPLVIYLVNGTIEPWMFVLGLVVGFGYWYFRIPVF